MKSSYKITLIILFSIAFLIGCKKEENYSCDPEINKWAKENFLCFQNASLDEISTLPPRLQKTAYRTLSAENKYNLWVAKLEDVKLTWDQPVQKRIEDLLSTIDASWFETESKTINTNYLQAWEHDMLYSWMDSINYYISFMTLSTIEDFKRLRDNPETIDYSWLHDETIVRQQIAKSSVPGGEPKQDCFCNWDISCGINLNDPCTKTNICEHTNSGCGLLCLYPCKGDCESNIILQR